VKEPLHLIVLDSVPIFTQLCLEEALLRTDERNCCVINYGAPPAIVMGISGKESVLIDKAAYLEHPLPVIRRFSGGGTVVIDANTFFVSFIGSDALLDGQPFPETVHAFAMEYYRLLFSSHNFSLCENDYVISEKKCGGNAQYFRKGRWLHHSSFLWDFEPKMMRYLTLPPRRPKYRLNRSHDDFLTSLKKGFSSIDLLQEGLLSILDKRFTLHAFSANDIEEIMQRPCRRTTEIVQVSFEEKKDTAKREDRSCSSTHAC